MGLVSKMSPALFIILCLTTACDSARLQQLQRKSVELLQLPASQKSCWSGSNGGKQLQLRLFGFCRNKMQLLVEAGAGAFSHSVKTDSAQGIKASLGDEPWKALTASLNFGIFNRP